MSLWLWAGLAVVFYCLYLWVGQGPWHTESKHFRLYKVLIDSSQDPNFSVTILKGDFPKDSQPGFVTYVLPNVAAKRGLKAHEIVGCLKHYKGRFVPENFTSNRAFKDMVHSIAAREIPQSVQAQAKALGTGQIRLLDDRIAALPANTNEEHCLGIYKVEHGVVVAYEPNPNFRLFSDQGPLELVESIRRVLYSESESANQKPDSRATKQ